MIINISLFKKCVCLRLWPSVRPSVRSSVCSVPLRLRFFGQCSFQWRRTILMKLLTKYHHYIAFSKFLSNAGSDSLFFCLSINPFIHPSVHPFIHLSILLRLRQHKWHSTYHCINKKCVDLRLLLFVHLSVRLSVGPFHSG